MGITIALILVGAGILGLIVVMCIPTKKEIPSFEKALKNSEVVWGLWFTGGRHYKFIKKYKDRFKMILVMKPDSLAFQTSTNYPDRSRTEIMNIVEIANKERIPIKWYSEAQEISFTIYDCIQSDQSFSDKAYYISSKLDKEIPRQDRVLHILKKEDDEDDFYTKRDKFMRLWNISEEAKPSINNAK